MTVTSRREIWDHPFGHALLKIERANKHITDIEQRLTSAADSHGVSLHVDIKTGEQSLYYLWTDRPLRSDVALMVGDAIHNLHCALDIAWVESLRAHGFGTAHAKFPVYPEKSRTELENTLTKTRKIPETSPLFDLVMNRVKTYQGGDADILALHQLDIDDKHHLLIPMLTVVGVNGAEVEYEDGSVDRIAVVLTSNIPWHRKLRAHAKIKNHGKPTFRVTFGNGDLRDVEVLPTLRRFSAKAGRIVRMLQRMQ